LSGLRRKVFSFKKTDLKWVDPLITEWMEENKGKNQSDLILELLHQYKHQREIFNSNDSQPVNIIEENKQNYFGRIRDTINVNFDKFQSHASKLQNELRERARYEDIKTGIGKSRQKLSDSFNKLENRVREIIPRPKSEDIEHSKVDYLEGEILRLQSIVKDLRSRVDEKNDDEQLILDQSEAIANQIEEVST